jgi:hypothetical protein
MSRKDHNVSNDSQQRQRALSRWENDGGAGPCGPQGNVCGPETTTPSVETEDLAPEKAAPISKRSTLP